MAAFPIWATLGAAWRDVADHKLAALRAGWPLLLVFLGSIVVQHWKPVPVPGADPREQLALLLHGPFLWAQLVVLPISICLASLNIGGWARFVARGESHWGLGQRSFGPVIIMQIKLILLIIGLAVVAVLAIVLPVALLRGHGDAAGIAVGVVGLAATVALVTLGVRLCLATTYAALTGRSDLRGALAVTRGHGWQLFRLLLVLILVAVGLALLLVVAAVLVGGIVGLGFGLVVKLAGGGVQLADFKLAIGLLVGLVLFAPYLALAQWGVGVYVHAYLALVPEPVLPEANPWHT